MKSIKKTIIGIFVIVFAMIIFCPRSNAAWTLRSYQEGLADNYLMWKVVCTSDGAALSGTTTVDLMGNSLQNSGATPTAVNPKLKSLVQGSSMMMIIVEPGTGSVIPDTTLTITLKNELGFTMWSQSGVTYGAMSSYRLDGTINIYLPVTQQLRLTMNDIGGSGDMVTLHFICWKKD